MSEEEKEVFAKNKKLAVERAKALDVFSNPSTTIYRLLDLLKNKEQ